MGSTPSLPSRKTRPSTTDTSLPAAARTGSSTSLNRNRGLKKPDNHHGSSSSLNLPRVSSSQSLGKEDTAPLKRGVNKKVGDLLKDSSGRVIQHSSLSKKDKEKESSRSEASNQKDKLSGDITFNSVHPDSNQTSDSNPTSVIHQDTSDRISVSDTKSEKENQNLDKLSKDIDNPWSTKDTRFDQHSAPKDIKTAGNNPDSGVVIKSAHPSNVTTTSKKKLYLNSLQSQHAKDRSAANNPHDQVEGSEDNLNGEDILRDLQDPGRWWTMWHSNPRMSMSFVQSKGLLNAPGENNCFLNSAVQVLWHLDVFRRSFRQLSGHFCMGNSCIFCALKVIFTQFQYSDQTALPPDALRKALAKTFQDQHRYQLGLMDDAAECFENILLRIHSHITDRQSEDTCTAKHCISHQKFTQTLVEQLMCPCGATSEPHVFNQMVQYVSTSALCKTNEAMCKQGNQRHLPEHMFGQLLKNASSQGDVRNCPSKCGRTVHIRRNLTNCPEVISVGLIWDSDRPSQAHISDVINAIGTRLRIPDLFDSVVNDKWAYSSELHLVGVVCYYGKHYSTFFFHSKKSMWISFDDANVKEMGHWRDVADKCYRGHYQPLLLLYANPVVTPVTTQTAPDKTTMVKGFSFNNDTSLSPREDTPSHSRQGSGTDRQLRPGGQNPHYNHALPSDLPGYCPPSKPSIRSRTPDPDDWLRPGDVSKAQRSPGEAQQATRRSLTPGPEWGRYDSDDEKPSNEKLPGCTEGGHYRQSSYLSAMEAAGLDGKHGNQVNSSQGNGSQGNYLRPDSLYPNNYDQVDAGYGAIKHPPPNTQPLTANQNLRGSRDLLHHDEPHRQSTNQMSAQPDIYNRSTSSTGGQYNSGHTGGQYGYPGSSQGPQTSYNTKYSQSNHGNYQGTYPSNQTGYPGNQVSYPPSSQGNHQNQRQYPSNQGQYLPSNQPSNQGQYPSNQGQYPSNQGQYLPSNQPSNQGQYPSNQGQYPSNQYQISNHELYPTTQYPGNQTGHQGNHEPQGIYQNLPPCSSSGGERHRQQTSTAEDNYGTYINRKAVEKVIGLQSRKDMYSSTPSNSNSGVYPSNSNGGVYPRQSSTSVNTTSSHSIYTQSTSNMHSNHPTTGSHSNYGNYPPPTSSHGNLYPAVSSHGNHPAYRDIHYNNPSLYDTKDPLKLEISDNDSQKDSGYRSGGSSGDRNSSSSANSAALIDSPTVGSGDQFRAYPMIQALTNQFAGSQGQQFPNKQQVGAKTAGFDKRFSSEESLSSASAGSIGTVKTLERRPGNHSQESLAVIEDNTKPVKDLIQQLDKTNLQKPTTSNPANHQYHSNQPTASQTNQYHHSKALPTGQKPPVNNGAPTSYPQSGSKESYPSSHIPVSGSHSHNVANQPRVPTQSQGSNHQNSHYQAGTHHQNIQHRGDPRQGIPHSQSMPQIGEDLPTDRLYVQAEGLMQTSSKKEGEGDFAAALVHCQQALGIFQQLLSSQNNFPESYLAQVRQKHSSCVTRSRLLHRQVQLCRQESHTSTISNYSDDRTSSFSSTSTDSDYRSGRDSANQKPVVVHERKSSKTFEFPMGGVSASIVRTRTSDDFVPISSSRRSKYVSDYVSREDYFARHPPPPQKVTSKPLPSSSSLHQVASKPSVPPKPPAKPRLKHSMSIESQLTLPGDNETHPGRQKDDNQESINIYATLPRRPKNRERSSTLTGNEQAEVYKAYMENQTNKNNSVKNVIAMHENHADRTVNHGAGNHGTAGKPPPTAVKPPGKLISHTRQWSKEEIRDLLVKDYMSNRGSEKQEPSLQNLVDRQMEQFTLRKSSHSKVHSRDNNGLSHDTGASSGHSFSHGINSNGSSGYSNENSNQNSNYSNNRPSNQSSNFSNYSKTVDNRDLSNHPSNFSNGQSNFSNNNVNVNYPPDNSIHSNRNNQSEQPKIQRVLPQHSILRSGDLPVTVTTQRGGALDNTGPDFPVGGTRDVISKLEAHEMALSHQPQFGSNVPFEPRHELRKVGSHGQIPSSPHKQAPGSPQKLGCPSSAPPPNPEPSGGRDFTDNLVGPRSTSGSNHGRSNPNHISNQVTNHQVQNSDSGISLHLTLDNLPPPPPELLASFDSSEETTDQLIPVETHFSAPTADGFKTMDMYVVPSPQSIIQGGNVNCLEQPAVTSSKHGFVETKSKDTDLADFCVIENADDLSSSGIERTDTQSDTSSVSTVNSRNSRGSKTTKHAKPALVKKKRHKPRKSVTFSDNIMLIAKAEEIEKKEEPDYIAYVHELLKRSPGKSGQNQSESAESKPSDNTIALLPVTSEESELKTGYDSDFDEDTDDSCNSEEIAGTDRVQCNLCRKKLIEVSLIYCADCSAYMSQFQPAT